MGQELFQGMILTPLKIIELEKGDVLHAAKASDKGVVGFGEAYFSTIKNGAIKAWKRHREATLNLIVPVGEIKFVLYDDRPDSDDFGKKIVVHLSKNNYNRMTVPPMIWMGFQGIGTGQNLLLNIINIPHDPEEADQMEMGLIPFDWQQE